MIGLAFLALVGYFVASNVRLCSVFFSKKSEKEWAADHPYHVFFKYELDKHTPTAMGVIGGSLVVVSWISTLCLIFTKGTWTYPEIWLAFSSGMAGYLGISFSYWVITGLPEIYQKATATINGWWQKAKNWWLSKVPAEVTQAKEICDRLLKLLKGEKHKAQFEAVAVKVTSLAQKEIPRLLKNEAKLIKLIALAEDTISAEKANGIMDGEEQLMAESEKDLLTLKKRLEDTRKKIQLIICFLNHFLVRLSVLVSADSNTEVQQSLTEVQQDLDQMLKADEEIAGLHEKYMQTEISARQQAMAEVSQTAEKLLAPPQQKVAAG